MQLQSGRFSLLPTIVKNLLIINGLFYLAKLALGSYVDLDMYLGLHYFKSPYFQPYQIITYMFMHANFSHILFNMFALWMFGTSIENLWGPKRFLIYYLLTGVGAAVIHYLILHFKILYFGDVPSIIIGASGSVMGILLAFGMMYPDRSIYLYFLFPIKAKYFVIGIAVMELIYGIFFPTNVANFAHLGGMLFGFIIIKFWQRNRFRQH